MLCAVARDEALRVIHLWDSPAIVRQYLETGDETIRDAAQAAALAASRAAAWAASRAATRAAARAAAGDDSKDGALAAARAAEFYAAGGRFNHAVATLFA
jgi:Arc/MetJ family transcription regulator